MKSILSICLIFVAVLIPVISHAEGNCPPGYYPTGAPQGQAGPQGCAPIPLGNTTAPAIAPTRWESRWGAIATDGPGGHLGVAERAISQPAAEREALGDCTNKGGINCQLENTYSNACAVMVVGEESHNSSSAPTLDEATAIGMATCQRSDKDCSVYYSSCSAPVRR